MALGRPLNLPPARKRKAAAAASSRLDDHACIAVSAAHPKDDPADAEAISHRLLVRGGYVRQIGSGLYAFLPLGQKVIERIAGILREEMDTLAMEVSMPIMNPAEPAPDGPLRVDNLFRLDDSSGKQYVLAMMHEGASR